jgi:hypothetical protein
MDIEKLAWSGIEGRLERGERVTKAEVARELRSYISPPPRVIDWIADALEGKLKGVGGAQKKGAFDKLLVKSLNPDQRAADYLRELRKGRKDNGEPLRGTLDDDLEKAVSRYEEADAERVRKIYEG